MKNKNMKEIENTVPNPKIKKAVPRITGGRVQAILESKKEMPPGIPYARYQIIMTSVDWKRMIMAHPEYFVEYKGHKYIKPEHKKDIIPTLNRLLQNPQIYIANASEYSRAG